MTKDGKIKLGLGLVAVGLLAFTADYLLRQVRRLVNTDFELDRTQVNKLSFKKISLTLWWKVVNKSDIELNVSDQTYDIYLNGKFVKKVGNAVPVDIKPNSTTYIPTYIVFAPKELIKVGLENLSQFLTKEGRKDLILQVQGSLTLKTSVFTVKKIPIEYEDDIEAIMNYGKN